MRLYTTKGTSQVQVVGFPKCKQRCVCACNSSIIITNLAIAICLKLSLKARAPITQKLPSFPLYMIHRYEIHSKRDLNSKDFFPTKPTNPTYQSK